MASRGINKVILIGNLGQDPELRYLPNGGAVANINVATSESWKDKQTGELKERTEWHRIVIFGKLAEIAGEYLKKGSQVYIEGSLQTRKWQDQNGQDRYMTEVVVNLGGVLQILGSRNTGESMAVNNQAAISSTVNTAKATAGREPAMQTTPPVMSAEPVIDFDDDIPF